MRYGATKYDIEAEKNCWNNLINSVTNFVVFIFVTFFNYVKWWSIYNNDNLGDDYANERYIIYRKTEFKYKNFNKLREIVKTQILFLNSTYRNNSGNLLLPMGDLCGNKSQPFLFLSQSDEPSFLRMHMTDLFEWEKVIELAWLKSLPPAG